MRKSVTGLLILLAAGAAWGEWNSESPQPWKEAVTSLPTYHNLGRDFCTFSTRGNSYIYYKAQDPEMDGVVREYALALARHAQIPEERVIETNLYHGNAMLKVVWRPKHSPFDKECPSFSAPTAWRIQVGLRGVVIQAKNDEGLLWALRFFLRVVEAASGPQLRRMIFEDWRELVTEPELRTLKPPQSRRTRGAPGQTAAGQNVEGVAAEDAQTSK